MTEGIIKLTGREWLLPTVAPAIVLLIIALVAGPALGAPFRPLFVLGCAAAGWYAWRSDPGSHLQAALFLFAFSPLARRVVDLSAGYDPAGLMLVGPLLAILVPAPSLWGLLESRTNADSRIAPNFVVAGCVAYAAALSLFQGNLFDAASGVLKWMAPLLYAASLAQSCDRDRMVQAATSAFLVILPVTGIIGVLQYIDPPAWDRYWMQFAPILSVGQPLPFEVRVFGTMKLRDVHGDGHIARVFSTPALVLAAVHDACRIGAPPFALSHGLAFARDRVDFLLSVRLHAQAGGCADVGRAGGCCRRHHRHPICGRHQRSTGDFRRRRRGR